MTLRQLPADRGAESQVLACSFLEPELIVDLSDIISAKHFSSVQYATVWDAMQNVWRIHGGFDVALLMSWLREAKLTDRAGGWKTINEINDLVGTTRHATKYAEMVRDYARRRAIILVSQDISAEGYEETIEDVEQWSGTCETRLARASSEHARTQDRTAAEVMDAFEKRVFHPETIETGPPLVTQYPTLNSDFTPGGIPRKLIIIMGRPGMGKTAYAMDLAAPWLDAGKCGAFFSMEMKEPEVCGRFCARQARVPYKTLIDPKKGMTEDETARFCNAGHTIREWRLIYDFGTALTASQIVSRSRRIKRRLGGLDFVIVDHFHKMDHGLNDRGRDDARMKASSGALMDLANNLDCTVILLAQLSRKCEERPDKKPLISDARECGALEEDAQLILSPFWPYYYRKAAPAYRSVPRNEAELLVLKNRDGDSGVIDLSFDPEIVRYRERI